MKIVINIILSLLKLYQIVISPLYSPCCRYSPSCSAYMIESVKKFNFLGIILGIIRILKCNPFGGHGFDPVPNKLSLLKWKSYEK
jgi:uncharacterized protein